MSYSAAPSRGVTGRVPWSLRASVVALFALCLATTFSLVLRPQFNPLTGLSFFIGYPLSAGILFWIAGLQRANIRRGWLWLAVVPLLIMATNLVYAWLTLHDRPLFPSLADLFYYAILGCFILAFRNLSGQPQQTLTLWQQRLDVAIFALALTLFLWRFLLSDIAFSYIAKPLVLSLFLLEIILLLLPLSIALLSVWREQKLRGVHTPSFTLAFLVHTFNVLVFFTQKGTVVLEHVPPSASFPLWTLFFLAASGLLGLRESLTMKSDVVPQLSGFSRLLTSLKRLLPYAPYVAMTASFMLLLDPAFLRTVQVAPLSAEQIFERAGILLGTILLSALVMARQILTMRENHRLNRELRAFSRELEQRVEERTKQLEDSRARLAANERLASLGRISAGLAHEINTPVASAMNSLQQAKHLAEEYEVSIDNKSVTDSDHHEIAKELRQALTTTDSSLERLGEFVRRMRGQVRAPSGKNDFEAVRVVQDALAMLEHRAKKANVQLVFEAPPPFLFYGDAARFSQVVSNLVVNALDACEDHWTSSSTVTVRLEQTPEGLRLEVQDNGAGIPKHLKEKIFEPLFTTKEVGKGTGLGLAIIQDIVYGHFDGSIRLESEVGAGTTFYVVLPSQKATLLRGPQV
jgi:signal transduction histidine kinase